MSTPVFEGTAQRAQLSRLIFAALLAASPAWTAEPLGLSELERMATENAPRLKAAGAASARAQANADAASGARGPRVDLQVYGRLANPYTLSINSSDGGTSIPLRGLASGGASLVVSQPLSGLYGLNETYAGAQRTTEAVRARAQVTEEDLLNGLSVAFYQHAAGVAQRDRVDAAVAASTARRDLARSMFQHGVGTETSLAEAELDLATALADRVTAQTRVDDQQAEIEVLVGVPIPADRVLSTQLLAPAPLALPDGWTDRLPSKAGQVVAARADAEAAARHCNASAQDLFPSLSIQGSAGLSAGDALQPGQGASASAVMNWNVLDWGVIRAQRSSACAAAVEADALAKDASLVARTSIRQWVRADEAAAQRHAAQRRALDQALELARLVEVRNKGGTATEADLLSARARLAAARAALADATASWLIARGRIDRLLAK